MRERLIVALDVDSLEKAEKLVEELSEEVVYFKVGLELFLNSEGKIIKYLKSKNKKIFLDLKFHDIPNTVAQAAKWATKLGVDMFNVHASGGEVMLKKVAEVVRETAREESIEKPLLIGVTVLTSFSEEVFQNLGFSDNIEKTALGLADICQKSSFDGVVCSAHEVQSIKEKCGQDFLTVCPGVRPSWAASGDQKRIMTPKKALEIGADYLVVGRPIIKAQDVEVAAKKVLEEMEDSKC